MTMQIRVFRLVIDSATWENLDDESKPSLHGAAWSYLKGFEWAPRGDNYWSQPVTNINPKVIELENVLNQYGVRFERSDEEACDLYLTNAPASYDYTGFGTMEIATGIPGPYGRPYRLVSLPVSRADSYQVPRYISGLHLVFKVR